VLLDCCTSVNTRSVGTHCNYVHFKFIFVFTLVLAVVVNRTCFVFIVERCPLLLCCVYYVLIECVVTLCMCCLSVVSYCCTTATGLKPNCRQINNNNIMSTDDARKPAGSNIKLEKRTLKSFMI
jgi:hypothetical protein